MLTCQYGAAFPQSEKDKDDHDWSLAGMAYPNLQELSSFISRQHLESVTQPAATTTDPERLQGKQLVTYNIVCAPTGVAAFNVDGYTLHSLLRLPVKGDFKQLEGNRLQTIQQFMTSIRYLIIDKMSTVGRKMFGQVDRRLRQAFPHRYVFITMQDIL